MEDKQLTNADAGFEFAIAVSESSVQGTHYISYDEYKAYLEVNIEKKN